jgi:hypothetical protein
MQSGWRVCNLQGRLTCQLQTDPAVLSWKAVWRRNSFFLLGSVTSLKAFNWLSEAHHKWMSSTLPKGNE